MQGSGSGITERRKDTLFYETFLSEHVIVRRRGVRRLPDVQF